MAFALIEIGHIILYPYDIIFTYDKSDSCLKKSLNFINIEH
jgi:hypothetical protein